jgi:hypothetical protein
MSGMMLLLGTPRPGTLVSPLCRDAISLVRTLSTSETMSSPSSCAPPPGLGREAGPVMEDMMPVMKASAVLRLASSLQDSAPESDTTSWLLLGPAVELVIAAAEAVSACWGWLPLLAFLSSSLCFFVL